MAMKRHFCRWCHLTTADQAEKRSTGRWKCNCYNNPKPDH